MKTIVLDKESEVSEVKATLKKSKIKRGDEIIISENDKSGIMIAVVAVVLYMIFSEKKRRVEDGNKILADFFGNKSKSSSGMKKLVKSKLGIEIKSVKAESLLSKTPESLSLAGIWKDRDIDVSGLRKKAWQRK
ncbi:MAG: hypothetical protein MUF42_00195 [Cytophagaceae bacterium]|jgi:hypothetical protein|nr:hypothetical protein [Cytophagaceae bacterium]